MRRANAKTVLLGVLLGLAGCAAPVGEAPAPGEEAEPYRSGEDWVVFDLGVELESELDLERVALVTHEDEGELRIERELTVREIEWTDEGLRVAVEEPFEVGRLYHLIERVDEGSIRTLDTLLARAPEGNAAGLTFSTLLFSVDKLAPQDPPPPPPEGDFALASTVPGDFERGLPRDLDMIRMIFTDDEQIDCARTGLSPQAGQLVSEIAGVDNHSFFHATEQDPARLYYRGTLECDSGRNELRFRIPPTGDLYGNGWYRFRTTAWSTAGSRKTFEVMFRTENPGLRVQVTQVQNHKSACGSFWWWDDKCDIYLAGNVAIDGEETATVKLPDPTGNRKLGDAEREEIFPIDSPTVIESTSNIGRSVRLSVIGFDSDGDDAKHIVEGAGALLTSTAPFCPECGAAGGVVSTVGALIPTNEDDVMGDMQIFFTDNVDRWNTTAAPRTGDPAYLGRRYDFPNGSLSVWVRSEEWPLVWKAPPIID